VLTRATPEMKMMAFVSGGRFQVMDSLSVLFDSLVERPDMHCILVSRAVRLLNDYACDERL
jgi:hypothetical protein